MIAPVSRKVLAGFAALGLAASATAAWVHANLIRNPDYSSICDINTRISCKQAYLSAYGSLAGVPVALGGVFFFVAVLLFLWGSGKSEKLRESGAAYIFVLSTLALGVVLYLAYASFFVLAEICPLCVATYVAVAGIWIVAMRANTAPLSSLPRFALRDAGGLITSTTASIIAVGFAAGVVWSIAAFPTPQERPLSILQPLPQDQRVELERWFDLQPKVEVPYSAGGAKVLLVKFNDYQCPACRATYFAYEPVLAKYKDRPQDVRFLLKHYALDSRCNPTVTATTHPVSCDAAAAVVMARANGASDKLSDWLFLHQDELNPAVVRRAAADIAGIPDFDARYPAAIEEVKADGAAGGKLGVHETPTFFLNGRKIPGMSAAALDALIELELRRQP